MESKEIFNLERRLVNTTERLASNLRSNKDYPSDERGQIASLSKDYPTEVRGKPLV